MFERFTDRARRVLVLAQEEARLLAHNYIGTEHILLGLLHEGQGVAATALTGLGITLDSTRAKVHATIGPTTDAPVENPPFTPRAKKVLEQSLREALQLGQNYIGTEHMLLGLVREGDGVAAQVLVASGAGLHRVRQAVLRILSVHPGREPGPRVASAAPVASESLVEAGPGVSARSVAVDPSTLLTWEDVEALFAESCAVRKATIVPFSARGLDYRSCTYEPGPVPSVTVTVAGADVSAEAFEHTTGRRTAATAEPVDGLGDAATFNRVTGTVRVLAGSVVFSVSVRGGHPDPRAAAVALARRALERLPPAAAPDEADDDDDEDEHQEQPPPATAPEP